MSDQNKAYVIMAITFVAGVGTLATQMLNPTPEVTQYILFAVAVLNLSLTTFFGASAVQLRNAVKSAKAK